MNCSAKVVQRWDIPQEEAAKRLGLTRPRTTDLLRGKLANFSLDALVNIAASATSGEATTAFAALVNPALRLRPERC
ncbi:helix-turn-helix domain-containing protein [Mesorhizobium japonicum]|uniref:helix-turn-helix domain-containing protein n=1 Tax=Mesorhizobium japonicum TaxID=2066070 RepID=UPI0009B59F74|nr:XRE family transcriptional regulator [Mesorhizobium japonicum]